MKLEFKDNSKVTIDVQMNNYDKLKDILEQNKIAYTDKHGNSSPKGW